MQKYIHVGDFQVLLRLVCDVSLIDGDDVVEDLLAEGGDEDLLLLVVCVQGEGGEELPDGLVEKVGCGC